MTEVAIGLDAGTSSAKGVALDPAGEIVATAISEPIAGTSQQVPEEIWEALTAASRRTVAHLPDASRVVAVAMAAQSGSVIPVEDVLGAASRAITWMDTRSRSLVDSWSCETASRIRQLSGWAASSGLGLATIAWLRATNAGTPLRWASVDDYLVFRLTGQWSTNPSNAAGMQLMDVSTLEWSDELCAIAGIDQAMLSTLQLSGDSVGELTEAAADAMGLPRSTPLVIGGHDQSCAALGLGAVSAGAMLLSLGTAWVLTVIAEHPEIERLPTGFNLSPHVVASRWTASQNMGALGAAPSARSAVACANEVRAAVEQASQLVPNARELIVVGGGTGDSDLTNAIADAVGESISVRPQASWPAIGAANLAWRHVRGASS